MGSTAVGGLRRELSRRDEVASCSISVVDRGYARLATETEATVATPSTFPRIKIVIYGTLGGVQTWSCGVSLYTTSAGVGFTQAQLDALAEGYWTDAKVAANARALLPYCFTSVLWLGVRAYYYPAGSTRAANMGQSSSAAMAGTAAAGSQHPNQCAIVATHLGAALGRRYTGRVYLPCNAAGMQSVGTFIDAITPILATAWANTLSAWSLRRFVGNAYVPVTFSSTTGGVSAITAVRVDNVYDTVRARRDKVIATSKSSIAVVVG